MARSPGAGRRPSPLLRRNQLLLLVAPVVAFALLAWQRRWMQEDAFINLRIVDQVVAGHGPVFDAGQRVEAYTSPLWLGVLVLLRVLLGWAVPMEWLAVLAGGALAVAGVGALVAGAAWLQVRHRRDRAAPPRLLVPAGVALLLGVPAVWDFATSGLETGLAVGWVGACFLALSRQACRADAEPPGPPVPVGVAVLLGLGPLVRPELVLYSVAFAIAAVRLSSTDRRGWAGRAGAFLALPLAYQLFRMGFFAAVVPNTALAKDAGSSLWDRGLRYFGNFAAAYALVVPALLLVALVAVTRPWRANRRWTAVALALAGPAVLQVLYVIEVGGDYMHGRFFVVPLVALAAPVAVVPVRFAGGRWRWQAPLLTGLAAWMLVAGIHLRPPVLDGVAIDDQRAAVVGYTHHQHPVRAGDQPAFFVVAARDLRRAARPGVFADNPDLVAPRVVVLPRRPGLGGAAANDAIGVTGYLLGTDVLLIDRAGLAEPIAARMPGTGTDARAGSAHSLPPDWLLARAGVRDDHLTPGARQALQALRCGALGRLVADTERPLTIGRFVGNVVDAFGNTTLRVPAGPADARRTFCGS